MFVKPREKYWLDRARRARTQAEQMVSDDAKRQLMEIAAGYLRLAKYVQERSSRNNQGDQQFLDSGFGPDLPWMVITSPRLSLALQAHQSTCAQPACCRLSQARSRRTSKVNVDRYSILHWRPCL